MRRGARWTVVVAAAAVAAMAAAPAAARSADDTVELDEAGQVTDRAGVLARRGGEVERALAGLQERTRLQLFVTYVHDFSGHEPQSWADAVADRNGLGRYDLLLAIGTDDRAHALSADVHSGLSAPQLARVEASVIRPALRLGDWAGAAIGAADGYTAVRGNQPVPKPRLRAAPADPGAVGSGGADPVLVPIALVAAGLVVLGYLARYGLRSRYRMVPLRWSGRSTEPPTQSHDPPLDELDRRARGLLIETDDAVRTRAEAYAYAAGAPPPALGRAATRTAEALRIRFRLDEPALERNDLERRRLLEEIELRCGQAGEALAAARPEVDEAAVRAGAAALPDRIAAAEEALRRLGERFGPAAVAPVAGHPAAARARSAQGAEALNRDDAAAAAAPLAGAGLLVDGVDRWVAEVERAATAFAQAVVETETDLAEAGGEHALREVSARAAAALAEARAMAAGDPFGALRRLGGADAVLARELASRREREDRNRRARSLFEQALLTAAPTLAAAQAHLTAHRESVGTPARTRLAQAAHLLERSWEVAHNDPATALPIAWRVDALAVEGRALARHDTGESGPMA
ncbi:TPM domain-containing protein [Streptomyces millisiae]|uniref:TPM domain-containing protein n=1 Tax=Streptomyces millisiae TaxID=3075542 RepID=A0ABU2LTV4_9ACTN|nr:TPM domain-containing protein [Streptomyces sp. DSM 44918]MDT0321023.1 TPM domain-containing protein [Streptomyces sp. DSM 44918]